jgi:carbamoyl-phosphate synthase large subunit
MKATGEVMSIAPSFEMALLKAVRGAEISKVTLSWTFSDQFTPDLSLKTPDDRRLFACFEALKQGVSVEKICEITRIDRFFIHKLLTLRSMKKSLKSSA